MVMSKESIVVKFNTFVFESYASFGLRCILPFDSKSAVRMRTFVAVDRLYDDMICVTRCYYYEILNYLIYVYIVLAFLWMKQQNIFWAVM